MSGLSSVGSGVDLRRCLGSGGEGASACCRPRFLAFVGVSVFLSFGISWALRNVVTATCMYGSNGLWILSCGQDSRSMLRHQLLEP